jgi:predicted CXXCH cytochrome family protein
MIFVSRHVHRRAPTAEDGDGLSRRTTNRNRESGKEEVQVKHLKATGLATAMLVFIATPAVAQLHDFTAATWTTKGESCSVCHTPHGAASTDNSLAPLWNHSDSSTVSYTMYTGYDLQGTVSGTPDGTTVLCLGCHDGQGTLDAFGGVPLGTATMTGAGYDAGRDLGLDLRNDHPVSISYVTGAGSELRALTYASGLGGDIETDLLDANTKVQCASCHDVHSSAVSMLRISNANDALCRTCHGKW